MKCPHCGYEGYNPEEGCKMCGCPPLSIFERDLLRYRKPPSWGIVILGIICTIGMLVLGMPWSVIAIAGGMTFVLFIAAIWGRKRAEIKQENRPCSWMLNALKQKPMTAEEIADHVEKCPICSRTLKSKRAKQTEAYVRKPKVSSQDFPTMMVIGIDTVGLLDFPSTVSLVRKENRELVVMGNRSPAFKDPNVLLEQAPKFSADPDLVLIFEKYPTKFDPFALDPLVIVRRTFLLEESVKGLSANSLGELAIELSIRANKRKLKVIYI